MARTYRSALREATESLQAHSPSAALDAEVLLRHALKVSRTELYAWPERELGTAEQTRFAALLAQRCDGHPVAHLIGVREFWSRDFQVSSETLIPRPETELLVERALPKLGRGGRVLDLGTGSGVIGITVALECAACEVTALDNAAAALTVARQNAARLGAGNIAFVCGDWYAPVTGTQFDLILSNPPYIAADDPLLQQGDVRFEPDTALIGGADGLDDLRQIIFAGIDHLRAAGTMLVEHGYAQGDAVRALFDAAGFHDVITSRDLAGHERVTEGIL